MSVNLPQRDRSSDTGCFAVASLTGTSCFVLYLMKRDNVCVCVCVCVCVYSGLIYHQINLICSWFVTVSQTHTHPSEIIDVC